MLENCPSVMVDDHVRCWNSMSENVPGLSVTTPLFSDGNSDYALWRMAPVLYCCSLPAYMHSFIHDPYNKNYSGFIYLPQAFRMQSRLQQENLTALSTCTQHVMDLHLGEAQGQFSMVERYIMCKCTPIPDKPKSTMLPDDNFEKVPRTN